LLSSKNEKPPDARSRRAAMNYKKTLERPFAAQAQKKLNQASLPLSMQVFACRNQP
jgi:hypothetical protein